jgi:chromosome segregation ATPase
MIESLMLMALGFFIATLFALAAARLVWRRAAKVTAQRLGVSNDEENDGAGHSADLEALLTRQRREVEPLHREIAELTRKNEALQGDTADLRARLEDAHAHVAARDNRLAALARELGRIGAALSDETRRQDRARETLQNLSKTATRLAEEVAPAPETAAEPRRALEPYADEAAETDRQTLAEIAASINRMDDENQRESAENEAADPDDQTTAEAHLGDRALAARIRALEAGVTS